MLNFMNYSEMRKFLIISDFFSSSDLGFREIFVCTFWLIFCPMDPHIFADPDPIGLNVADPDPKHCY